MIARARTNNPSFPLTSLATTTAVHILLTLAALSAAITILVADARRNKDLLEDENNRAAIMALLDAAFVAVIVTYEAMYTVAHGKCWKRYFGAARVGEVEFDVVGEGAVVGGGVEMGEREMGERERTPRGSAASESTVCSEGGGKKDEEREGERVVSVDSPRSRTALAAMLL